MKKIFLPFIFLFFLTGSIYSQDFYFGMSPGEVSCVYSKTGNQNFNSHMYAFQFSGNFIFSTIFKNNLELETGIMYYPYPYIISGPGDIEGRFKPGICDAIAYHAFSLPLHVGYKFKLANRLYANIHSGLNFDFYFNSINAHYIPYKAPDPNIFPWEEETWSRVIDLTYCVETTLKQKFNILFANKVSLQYFTKFNMGISLYAAYYSGLFQVWESHFHYTYDDGQTIQKTTFLSRGSFWNFGLELGYKFDKNYLKERKASSASRKAQRKKIYELLDDW